MHRIFVSTLRNTEAPGSTLIGLLRNVGFQVDHSPRNPMDGPDPLWDNWYAGGLVEALAQADAFIIALEDVWECSSWMGSEADMAMCEPGRRHVPLCYYWNPDGIDVRARGMLGYLKTQLPNDAEALIRLLRSDLGLT